MVKVPEPEKLAQIKAAGIDHVEVVFNYFWRNAPENECYTRAYRVKALLEEAGLKVWSCHLPFSRQLDISVPDPALREENVLLMERMIRLASIFGPQRLVLHPSSEPIADEEREIRLQNSANSIGRLALSAKEIGAVLCIENLPRTCLGRDSGRVCGSSPTTPKSWSASIRTICFRRSMRTSSRPSATPHRRSTLRTTTARTRRHWLPGEGVIDWPDFLRRLQASGYKGVFMHEVRAGVNATPENVVKAYKEVILGKMKK